MFKQFSNSRGVSPIIGLLLILVILVGILLVVRSEVVFITSTVFNPESREDLRSLVEVLGVDGDQFILGVTRNRNDLRFERLEINGNECFDEDPIHLSQGINRIEFNRTFCPESQLTDLRFQVNGFEMNHVFEAGELVSDFVPIQAFGGNITNVIIDGVQYRIHAFLEGTSTFNVINPGTLGTVDVLVVGGGGGASGRHGGGGGAGGLIFREELIITEQNYPIIVGAGGIGMGDPGAGSPCSGGGTRIHTGGQNSSAFSLIAIGGGRGDTYGSATQGGSAGGAGWACSPILPLQPISISGGFGSTGGGGGLPPAYQGGGGGGSAQSGQAGTSDGTGGRGGDGLYFGDKFTNIFGDNGYFAGGGGGGNWYASLSPSVLGGAGGLGGGGNAGVLTNGQNGQPNTGGGAGGGGGLGTSGGDGGSGIVLIRYPLTNPN